MEFKRVKEKSTKKGMKLKDENEGGWKIKQVSYIGNTMLMAESREDLQYIVEFGRVYNRTGLKTNVGKPKTIRGRVVRR